MSPKKERNTLYGSRSENTCAFCAMHGKALTPKQMQTKQCLAKQCTALVRHEHPYWDKREERKLLRKQRKERLNALMGGASNGICTKASPGEGDRVSAG